MLASFRQPSMILADRREYAPRIELAQAAPGVPQDADHDQSFVHQSWLPRGSAADAAGDWSLQQGQGQNHRVVPRHLL